MIGFLKIMITAFLMLTVTISILWVVRVGMEKFLDLVFGKEKQ
jgi:hypothetical protein